MGSAGRATRTGTCRSSRGSSSAASARSSTSSSTTRSTTCSTTTRTWIRRSADFGKVIEPEQPAAEHPDRRRRSCSEASEMQVRNGQGLRLLAVLSLGVPEFAVRGFAVRGFPVVSGSEAGSSLAIDPAVFRIVSASPEGRYREGRLPPMKRILCCLVADCRGCGVSPPVLVQDTVELFRDDFSRFPPGVLSAPIGQLNGAIQEYHYIEHRGVRTHPWRNPIVHLDSWAAGDEDGEPVPRAASDQRRSCGSARCSSPAMKSGATTRVEARSSRSRSPRRRGSRSGIAPRGTTTVRARGRHAAAAGGPAADREEFRVSAWRELAVAPFAYDTKTWYRLEVERGGRSPARHRLTASR